jgi:hypothetical protein
LLHMQVFIQRLEDEFGTSLISTAPCVSYRCELKDGTVRADAAGGGGSRRLTRAARWWRPRPPRSSPSAP